MVSILSVIFSLFWYYTLFLFIKRVYYVLYYFYMHYIRPARNLTERYGEKSWAMITGATDGIGKGFAIELAKLNFNIILVSRTQSKLDIVAEEVRKLSDYKVEVKAVEFDFSKRTKPEDYNKAFGEFNDFNL